MPENACLTFYFFKLFISIIQNYYRLICIGLGLRLVDFGIVPWESASTCILNSIGLVESFRSWLSHLFRGRPGGRRHVRSGGWLNDMLMWSWRAMFDGIGDGTVKSDRSAVVLDHFGLGRVIGFQADISGGKHPEPSHQLIVRSRCMRRIVTQTKQCSWWCSIWPRPRSNFQVRTRAAAA